MRKLFKIIKEPNIICPNRVIRILSPEKIYLPLPNDFIFSPEKTHALIGQNLLDNYEYYHTPSVSGTIGKLRNMTCNNLKISCLVINNDYKEKKAKKSDVSSINNKNDLINLLTELKLFQLSETVSLSKPEYLILNCVVDEPYQYNQMYYLKIYGEEILDIMDTLSKLLTVSKPIVVLKNIDSNNIDSFVSVIGTYANLDVKLVEDNYLQGKKHFLCQKLNINEKKAIVLNPEQIYQLHNAIKYNKRTDYKFIGITDLINKKCYMLKVKLYANLEEILDKAHIKIKKDVNVISNGLMTGYAVNPSTEVITEDNNNYYLIKGNNLEEMLCINCGKCYQVCPVKVNPKYHMENSKKSKNCIDCGLCSYFCPSHINLRKYLKGDSHE